MQSEHQSTNVFSSVGEYQSNWKLETEILWLQAQIFKQTLDCSSRSSPKNW